MTNAVSAPPDPVAVAIGRRTLMIKLILSAVFLLLTVLGLGYMQGYLCVPFVTVDEAIFRKRAESFVRSKLQSGEKLAPAGQFGRAEVEPIDPHGLGYRFHFFTRLPRTGQKDLISEYAVTVRQGWFTLSVMDYVGPSDRTN